jgi:hypothetical protein
MRERGMSWDDLRSLIRRNQASNAIVTYYRDRNSDPKKIGVFDRGLPRRDPSRLVDTGYSEADHWRDSHVCEAAWFNGQIPIESSRGIYEENKHIKEPHQGVMDVLGMLLSVGSLRRTEELHDFFTRHGRRGLPKSPTS